MAGQVRSWLAVLAVFGLFAGACSSDGDSSSSGSADDAAAEADGLGETAQQVFDSSPYESARWSWEVADTADGASLLSNGAELMTLLGSTT